MTDRAMADNVCVVTGASRGIGRETALGLARLGATVVMVGRDPTRGASSVAYVRGNSGNDAVHLALADLSSQREIRTLAGDLTEQYERIDVLVNNAGAVNLRRTVTADGIELTWAVNHLAYFLLTNLLLPVLRESAPARVVNVSSDAHKGGRMRFEDLQGERRYSGWAAYSQSKLANLLFTYELAHRLAGTGVTANAVHPGTVSTGFGKNNPGWLRWGITLAGPFMLSAAQGAETVIYLASSPDVEGVSGKYFVKCREVESTPASHDEADARRLWQVSEQMTGLGGG